MAQAMLGARHAGERILRCWGGSGGVVVGGVNGGTADEEPTPEDPAEGASPAGKAAAPATGPVGSVSSGGRQGPASDAKERIVRILAEYEAGGDLQEACQCLREMSMPFFQHEVVKKAITLALEKRSPRPLDVLREGVAENLITDLQMEMGLKRLVEALDDLALDIPDVAARLGPLVAQGKAEKWIPSDFEYSSAPAEAKAP